LREILVGKTGGRKSYQLVRRRVFWLGLVEVAVARPTMSVLYGLAWHNELARQPVLVRRANGKKEFHE